ncbi:MAG: ATP-binding protein [bacterium]|nr:ATP-binding protein [bacterium]
MDPVRNPYNPGAGVRPPALVGRDEELRSFDVAVQRLGRGRHDRSILLSGLRGVGKTVLLQEFGRIAHGHQWVHQHVEATEGFELTEAMALLARNAILRLSPGKRIAENTRRALGALRAFQVRWELPEGAGVVAEIDPLFGWADSGRLDNDLGDLFAELGQLARDHQRGVLFTIDEMQYLARDRLGALITALHRVSQLQLPLVVAGAGLPSLLALVGDARSYAERLFAFRTINSLNHEEAIAALAVPSEQEEVEWQTAALNAAIEATKGYPYFLQEIGKHTWELAPGPDQITADDVEIALPVATEGLDSGFFRVRVDRTTAAERDYLKAMASLGPGPHSTGDIASVLDKTTPQVNQFRDALIKRGLCYSPRHGHIDFTVPMFGDFIMRRLH